MADDIRTARWDLIAPAGMTRELVFTRATAITSLSLYVGGTVTDVDDLTDATEYEGTLSTTTVANDTATVDLVVPTGSSVPLRLVVDGEVESVGRLTPSTNGTASPDNTITLSAASGTFTITLSGGGGGGGVSDHGELDGLGDDDHTIYALADGSRGAFDASGAAAAAQAHAVQRANHTGTQAQSTVTNLTTDLAAKAPLASPALTGTPTAPTAAPGTATTQVATTAFVDSAVSPQVVSSLQQRRSGGYFFPTQSNNYTGFTNDREVGVPWAGGPTIAGVFIYVPVTGNAGDIARIGLREDNGGVPGALVAELASAISLSTTGLKTVTGLSQATTAGELYWLTIVGQFDGGGSPAVSGTNSPPWSLGVGGSSAPSNFNANQRINGFGQNGVSGALPGTFTVATEEVNVVPIIGVIPA